jgi:hypothetical protein
VICTLRQIYEYIDDQVEEDEMDRAYSTNRVQEESI